MVKSFSILFLQLLISLPALALPWLQFNRNEYAKEAASEMETYFAFLNSDFDFKSKLSTGEKSQFEGLVKVTQELGIQGGPALKFSDKAEDFILNPGEPERSAKTTEILLDPIYINLRNLNSEKNEITYLDVVQLLIHELGHKLGDQKVQADVDSLASKVIHHLRSYSMNEPLYMRPGYGPPRPLQETFETLSIPKRIGSKNPEPTIFFIHKLGPKKVRLFLSKHLAGTDPEKIVQINRVTSYILNGMLTDVRFSISKAFETPRGPQFVFENAYKLKEEIFVYDGQMEDRNFSSGRPLWIRKSSSFDFQVLQMKEISRTADQLTWELEFTGKPKAQNIYLLVGTEDRNFPLPCKLVSSSESSSLAHCTYTKSLVTSIHALDILQLMVDGEVADLPELLDIDLEARDFQIPFVLSDLSFVDFKAYTENNRKVYDFVMETEFSIQTVVVRCNEEKDFVLNGQKLGTIQTAQEQVYFAHELPLKSRSQNQWTFKVSCQSENSTLSEVLVTDGSGYTSMPRWK